MNDIIIPDALGIATVSWMLANTSRSGGAGIGGGEQVLQLPTGRWTSTLTFNVFSGLEDPSALLYRSLIRRGRAATILVPEADNRGPAQLAGIAGPPLGVRHSDDSSHSDGSGYAQNISNASFRNAVRLNSVQMQIQIGQGLSILPGMRFSTPDYRMHEIDEVLDFDGTSVWTVAIAPWLRSAYPAGTALNFDSPICRMRLAADDTGKLTIGNRVLDTPQINFVEAF